MERVDLFTTIVGFFLDDDDLVTPPRTTVKVQQKENGRELDGTCPNVFTFSVYISKQGVGKEQSLVCRSVNSYKSRNQESSMKRTEPLRVSGLGVLFLPSEK